MTTNIVNPPNSVTLNDFKRGESLLSVKDLKERYLWAVDFRDKDGIVLPDETFKFYIDSAVTELEFNCDMVISPTLIKEDRDYNILDYFQWCFMELDYSPVVSVEHFQIRFMKNTSFVDFPDKWIRLDNHTGIVRIAATEGEIQNWIMTQFSFLPRMITRVHDFPHFFHIEYYAGFEQDQIPKVFNHVVGMMAACNLLNLAGELVLGAGIASQSLSIDGLSQSINTTASAENHAYSARVKQYQTQIKDAVGSIKRFYGKDIRFAVV